LKSEALESQTKTLTKDIEEANRRLVLEEEKRKDTKERRELEERANELTDVRDRLQTQLAEFQRYDMNRLRDLKKQETVLKQEINDFTDNIFTVKKWILKMQPGFKEEDINRAFDIPEDLDNI
jgi:hypothetical protein